MSHILKSIFSKYKIKIIKSYSPLKHILNVSKFSFTIYKLIITVTFAMKINKEIHRVVAEFLARNRCLLNVSYNTANTSDYLTITIIINVNKNNKIFCCVYIIKTVFMYPITHT